MEALVSCIMPTAGRPAFAAQAVRYFLAQSHAHRELVIVERGPSALRELLPRDGSVRHVVVREDLTIGAMRNLACQLARGEVIAHWDDDDWHGPDRLARQVEPLLGGGADVTALRGTPMLELGTFQFWQCSPELHRRIFRQDVHGGTLVYRRRLWDRLARYPDTSLAEDAAFLEQALRRGARLRAIDAAGLFVYVRHESNAWAFRCGRYTDCGGWEPVAESPLPAADGAFYRAQRSAVPGMPLVSCIMPTRDRPEFARRAIGYFRRQNYPAKELVVVDDGTRPIEDLVPREPSIAYHRLRRHMVLGAKRNLACGLARGTVIAHWDDDDWAASDRLLVQVAALRRQRADVCGAGSLYFYEPARHLAWRYTVPPEHGGRWVAGASLCYTRDTWVRAPFPAVRTGEDTLFVTAGSRRVVDVSDADCMVAIVHEGNTAPRSFHGPCWKQVPPERVEHLIGLDDGVVLPNRRASEQPPEPSNQTGRDESRMLGQARRHSDTGA